MKTKILTTIALTIFAGNVFSASAHDFEVPMKSGNVFYANVLDTLLKTVELTYAGEYSRPDSIKVSGVVNIPETVPFKGKNYKVVRIGVKAFCSADRIETVILPSSVSTIAEFAFEGCTSLKSIVFPGSQVEICDGAFWNCTDIEEVVFGSDWVEVDLGHFRWSTALKTIEIPTKVRKIQNLRNVKSLENIYVDTKNSAFASDGGLLYSADKKDLYACPVAHKEAIVVPEGTQTIIRGAFLECGCVTSVTLPATLKNISFVEFAELASLTVLIFNSETPIMTAMFDGNQVFALKLARPVKLYVPGSSTKIYAESVCSSAGIYESIDEKDKVECAATDMLVAKNIYKIK